MVNPISNSFNMFLGFLEALPEPIRWFLFVVLALFFITAIIRIVMQH